MQTLVRDNYPKLAKENDLTVNYAIIQNKELLMAFLRQKLAEEVNAFLNADAMTLDKLVDIQLVINTLLEESNISQEDFKLAYDNSIEQFGKFNDKYILFYSDAKPAETTNQTEAAAPEAESTESTAE